MAGYDIRKEPMLCLTGEPDLERESDLQCEPDFRDLSADFRDDPDLKGETDGARHCQRQRHW